MSEDSPSLPKLPRLRPDREKFAIVPTPHRKVVHVKGASLQDAILPDGVHIQDAIIPEGVHIQEVILPEEASLQDPSQPEEGSLQNEILPEEASLHDAILPEGVSSRVANLLEESTLQDAILPEKATLQDAILTEEATLQDAILPEEASFQDAILPEKASLHDAILLLPKPPLPQELIPNKSDKSPIDKSLLKEQHRKVSNPDLPTSSPMTPHPIKEPRHLREKWLVPKCSKKRPLLPQSPLLQEPALHQLQPESSIPMTFYPSMEELTSFDTYVAYMESQGAHKAGIARIVPPKDWTARKAGYEPSEVDIIIDNPVKQIIASTKVPGAFTTIGDRSIPSFTLPEYLRLATSPKYLTPSHSTYEELEQLYWQQNQDPSIPSPIYGADIQTSLTDPDQAVFNLSNLPNILSAGMSEEIPGINTPYCYVGMWRATFSWHVEDMDLYATNLLHYGASKTWYCVPPEHGYKLEQLAQKLFPEMAETCFNLLRHKAVMIGPNLLKANGIPFNKMVHEQGTIMVVFPHAYHSGFNHGFNMAETLNFALPRWVEYGKRFRGCCCGSKKMSVRVDMDKFVERFQPDMLNKWRRGEDFALHPEDPEFVKMYFEELTMRAKNKLINQEDFETLKEDLMLKREIKPWFKEKFPLDYNDIMELVIKDDVSKETKVDENDNEIPGIPNVVNKLTKRPFVECFVEIKCLDEEVATKHLDEMKAYKAILKEQRLELEAKTVAVKVGQAGGGSGFKGVDKEDLKAKKSLVLCSAKRKHKFKACSMCPGCLEPSCDVCVHCVDSPRNGGRNVLRQKCVQRLCINPVMATCTRCRWQI